MIEKNDQTVPVADGRPFLAPNCYVKNILNLTIHLDENYVVHVLAYLLLKAQSATFPGANLLWEIGNEMLAYVLLNIRNSDVVRSLK